MHDGFRSLKNIIITGKSLNKETGTGQIIIKRLDTKMEKTQNKH